MKAEDENKLRSLIITLNIRKSIRPQLKATISLPWKNGANPEVPVLDSQSEVDSIQSAVNLEAKAKEKQSRKKAGLMINNDERMVKVPDHYTGTIQGSGKDPRSGEADHEGRVWV